MKLRYIFMAAAAIVLASCVKDAISPMQGLYQKPEDVEMTKVLSYPVEKLGGVRCFTVEIATEGVSGSEGNYSGDGTVLNLKLYGDKYFIENSTYSAADATSIKKGFYLVGDGGSTFTRVNSGKSETVALDHGGISISSENGVYTLTGSIWLANSDIIKLEAKVSLTYLPDPEPVRLNKIHQAQSNLQNGTPSVTLVLSTEGVTSEFDFSTFSNIYKGNGNYIALDLYSPDGYLYPGTYTPSPAGGAISEGNYGIGWDPGDLLGIGIYFTNWGTCWWTVENDVTSAEKITEGEVKVVKEGSNYVITYNCNGIFFEYKGAIEALDPDGGFATVNNVLSSAVNGSTLSLVLATDGVTSIPMEGFTMYAGNGNYLALDIWAPGGVIAEGEYTACSAGGNVTENTFGIGWDPGDLFGIGVEFTDWGTCWWTVNDEGSKAEKVLDGKITVTKDGDIYTISLVSTTVKAKFVGNIAL
ncbi:MAG: hypothetical protein ACI4TM_04670 [Candidatus Cryptobacteroides sp.]